MKKLMRLLLTGVDFPAIFICLIALMALGIPPILVGVVEAVKQAGKELDDIWRQDRVVAYVVLASLLWCVVRWKEMNRPGPHEPIFQSKWARRLVGTALPGIFGLAMAGCVVALIHSFIKNEFRHIDSEDVIGIFFWGIMSAMLLRHAYRTLRGLSDD